jgi:NADH dehydrogenase
MPISGRGRAVFQPIWADDVARCVCAVLDSGPAAMPAAAVAVNGDRPSSRRYELAGPHQLSYEAIVRLALRSFGKRRPIVHVPTPIVSRCLRAIETLARDRAFATWDEAELMEVSMVTSAGTADARRLGVEPRAMADVLGVSAGRPPGASQPAGAR